MPELLRSLVAQLREVVGNRRRARRYRASVPFSVSLHDPKQGSEQLLQAPHLEGVTHDISATGLGLVVPAIRINDRYLSAPDQTLRLLLQYPGATMEMHVIAVRYEQLDRDGASGGYLIGVRITWMSEADRTRFDKYLKELA